ncbi:MAG: tRNA (adenosine(37)-N6)-dimethylallyltransferase MiaA [Patescibacteria group bacterium]
MKKPKINRKIIVVLGPTASGKSDLAVKLAKKFDGEVISADSRQVYRGMDIGTGKVTKKEMRNIPHYLLDVSSPKKRFTVTEYRELAEKALNKIFTKKKIPIICGGTGFYIQSLIDGTIIPEVIPDWELRKKLEKKSVKELYDILKELDPKRARNIDKNNPRRLIRAIEIVRKTKKPIPVLKGKPLPYPVLLIGVKKEPDELKKLIRKRLLRRLKSGMVSEIKKLRKSGISWKRLEEFGLEYRYIALYLQKKISYKEMVELLQKKIRHFSKRQMTWFKRDKRIHWIKNYIETEKLIKPFLN